MVQVDVFFRFLACSKVVDQNANAITNEKDLIIFLVIKLTVFSTSKLFFRAALPADFLPIDLYLTSLCRGAG